MPDVDAVNAKVLLAKVRLKFLVSCHSV
jgi:hypothetical protein